MATEVEVKLGAWPGFEVPPLDGALEGLHSEPGSPRELDATYHDATDLRLIRAGITLRHRHGEGGADGAWTLKFPGGGGNDSKVGGSTAGDALVREELVVPGPAGPPPAELAALIRPWLRTAPLTPVAHLRTVRRSSALRFDDRGVVGSVDDDEVSVLQAGRVAARFREVEVEVAGAAPEGVLDAVVGRLRAAGAGAPDPTPKLVRALGPRALQPPDLVVADLGRDASAAEVLRAGIAVAVLRIVEHDRTIRDDAEPEGIHQARVGTRRLRSDLRTFASLLDTAWSEPLRDELRWLAGEFGEVRDRDVLAGRLRAQIAELDEDDRVAAGGVLVKLDRERTRAVARAVGALDSRRYLALLDRLVEAANDPRTLAEAEMRAREVLPGLAGATFHSLRKGVKQLGKHPKDEALHRLRIKAKRARYAADVAVPVVGEPAKTYTKAMGALQDVLGDHHDCSVAAEWLRGALPGATKAEAFALGLLVARQHHRADQLRSEWRAAWDALDRPKLVAWFDG